MFRVVLLLIVLASVGFAQNASTNMPNTIQPAKSLPGTSISYTGGIYTLPSSQWGKAAELSLTGTAGVLRVHLVKDPASQYYSMPLEVGGRNSALFDKVIQSGTTVDVTKVTIFLNEPL